MTYTVRDAKPEIKFCLSTRRCYKQGREHKIRMLQLIFLYLFPLRVAKHCIPFLDEGDFILEKGIATLYHFALNWLPH